MSEADFGGRVALVTGAARRVGAHIAHRLHEAGATVVIHYRHSATDARALAGRLEAVRPGSAHALGADLLDGSALARLAEDTLTCCGRLDFLVNNASSFYATPLGTIDEHAWRDLVGTNLAAPLLLTQALAPALRAAAGAVVNIADIHAERPLAGYPLYCAAKAGLVGLTRALAIELAPQVRVNAVAPGPIDWPADGSFDAAAQQAVIDHTLLKRIGAAEDIAAAVEYLLAAPYVTGQVLAVDGGRSAHL